MLLFRRSFKANISHNYFYTFFSFFGVTEGYQISILMVISVVFQIIGAKVFPYVEKRMKQEKMIWFFSALLCLMLLVSFVSPPAMLTICFISINTLSALSEPIFSNSFNRLIPSSSRATLLSVSSMLYSVAMIILFPITGWLVERISFSVSFGLLGVISFLALMVLFFSQDIPPVLNIC